MSWFFITRNSISIIHIHLHYDQVSMSLKECWRSIIGIIFKRIRSIKPNFVIRFSRAIDLIIGKYYSSVHTKCKMIHRRNNEESVYYTTLFSPQFLAFHFRMKLSIRWSKGRKRTFVQEIFVIVCFPVHAWWAVIIFKVENF